MGDQVCKLKIILDSGSAAGYAQAISNMVMNFSDKDAAKLTNEVAYPIIERLVYAESALEQVHNLLLDAVGYTGPRPGSYPDADKEP